MKTVWIIIFLSSFFLSCSMQFGSSSESNDKHIVRIITWNLQTFFDSQTVGTEYEEYRGSKTRWDEEKYKKRVKTLCSFIETTKADVYIFQEIENSAILQDINNELERSRIGYGYSGFSKNEEDALGIAIFSRHPLQNVSAHQIDIQTALNLSEFETSSHIIDGMILEQPSMRSLLKAQVVVNEGSVFSLYACHWKSKFGGSEKSEVWRNAQERLLADILLNETNTFLVTGDFNRTLEEFMQDEKGLQYDDVFSLQGTQGFVQVTSPWLTYDGKTSAPGSYYYQGSWEKIDHFFMSPEMEVLDFQTITNIVTLSAEGIPFRYEVYTGNGTSDHLPLLCVIEL